MARHDPVTAGDYIMGRINASQKHMKPVANESNAG
jgi:hypothetical protein